MIYTANKTYLSTNSIIDPEYYSNPQYDFQNNADSEEEIVYQQNKDATIHIQNRQTQKQDSYYHKYTPKSKGKQINPVICSQQVQRSQYNHILTTQKNYMKMVINKLKQNQNHQIFATMKQLIQQNPKFFVFNKSNSFAMIQYIQICYHQIDLTSKPKIILQNSNQSPLKLLQYFLKYFKQNILPLKNKNTGILYMFTSVFKIYNFLNKIKNQYQYKQLYLTIIQHQMMQIYTKASNHKIPDIQILQNLLKLSHCSSMQKKKIKTILQGLNQKSLITILQMISNQQNYIYQYDNLGQYLTALQLQKTNFNNLIKKNFNKIESKNHKLFNYLKNTIQKGNRKTKAQIILLNTNELKNFANQEWKTWIK